MLQIAVIGLRNWGPRLVRCLIDPIRLRLQAIPCGNRKVVKSADWKAVVVHPAIGDVLIATPAGLVFKNCTPCIAQE